VTAALLRGRRSKSAANLQKRIGSIPTLFNLKERWRIMDRLRDYVQIITLATPSIETLENPTVAKELAKLANGGMAALVDKYPDRFVGFVASLPMNMWSAVSPAYVALLAPASTPAMVRRTSVASLRQPGKLPPEK
jgi:hypothetical protein